MPTSSANAKLRRYRFAGLAASLVGVVVALSLAVGATASGGSSGSRLFAYVVQPNSGPVHVGEAVWDYIYVANANRPTNTAASRLTLPNAYVVDDVNIRVIVDGTEYSNFTVTPPPNVEFPRWAGRWASTVECPIGTPPPCTAVGKPAVIPGENTVVLFPGWGHGADEPNGTYVFKYTVHGTQNGIPVNLMASSPPIEMTD